MFPPHLPGEAGLTDGPVIRYGGQLNERSRGLPLKPAARDLIRIFLTFSTGRTVHCAGTVG